VSPAAKLLATAPEGGQNSLTARELLTVRGTLDASTTIGTGTRGDNHFTYPSRRAPVVQGIIDPAAGRSALTTCPQEGNTVPRCLNPCPVCGNGMIEFPETCDRGVIPATSCSGCSIYCVLENCNDGLVCTGDSCNPTYGCRNRRTPGCSEPTATRTGTPPTATPSLTRTATRTATAAPPSATPSAIPTASSTPSSTPTATASMTPTGPVATASASLTPTGPVATATSTPACPGDCTGDGSVAVNELIVGVNIALGNAVTSACPPFDRNADGTVSISELIAAVGAALNGC
jgi:hypothetical protein